jgi:hypothetical protein
LGWRQRRHRGNHLLCFGRRRAESPIDVGAANRIGLAERGAQRSASRGNGPVDIDATHGVAEAIGDSNHERVLQLRPRGGTLSVTVDLRDRGRHIRKRGRIEHPEDDRGPGVRIDGARLDALWFGRRCAKGPAVQRRSTV